jgi:hypothetical protein
MYNILIRIINVHLNISVYIASDCMVSE